MWWNGKPCCLKFWEITGVSRKRSHWGTAAISSFVSTSCQNRCTSQLNSCYSNEYIQGVWSQSGELWNEHMVKVTFKDLTLILSLSLSLSLSLPLSGVFNAPLPLLTAARCVDILSLWSRWKGADIFVEHKPTWKLCNLDSINNEEEGAEG